MKQEAKEKPIDLATMRKKKKAKERPTMSLDNLNIDEREVLDALNEVLKSGDALDEILGHITGQRLERYNRLTFEENRVYDILLNKMEIKKGE